MEIIETTKASWESSFGKEWRLLASLKFIEDRLEITGYGIKGIRYQGLEITDPGYCGYCDSRPVVVDYNKPRFTRFYFVYCKNCKPINSRDSRGDKWMKNSL